MHACGSVQGKSWADCACLATLSAPACSSAKDLEVDHKVLLSWCLICLVAWLSAQYIT
jgi:hypothetical protein